MRARVLLAFAVVAIAPAPQPQQIVITRVFPAPGQIGAFIADADGSNEHPLVAPADIDYDAVWSPDGKSIVFTSERNGSADLYRIQPDGSGLQRLTDSPGVRRSSRIFAGREATRIRQHARRRHGRSLHAGHRDREARSSSQREPPETSVLRGRPMASGSHFLPTAPAISRFLMAAGSGCKSPTSTSFVRMGLGSSASRHTAISAAARNGPPIANASLRMHGSRADARQSTSCARTSG